MRKIFVDKILHIFTLRKKMLGSPFESCGCRLSLEREWYEHRKDVDENINTMAVHVWSVWLGRWFYHPAQKRKQSPFYPHT